MRSIDDADVDADGNGVVNEERLYQLVVQSGEALRSTTIKGKQQTVRRDAANRRGSWPRRQIQARLWGGSVGTHAVTSASCARNQRRVANAPGNGASGAIPMRRA